MGEDGWCFARQFDPFAEPSARKRACSGKPSGCTGGTWWTATSGFRTWSRPAAFPFLCVPCSSEDDEEGVW